MVNKSVIEHRFQCAQQYLDSLELSLQINWLEQYELYRKRQLSLPSAFALVHPWHYEDLTSTEVASVRGNRRFSKEVSMKSILCSSEIIWGYKCCRRLREKVQADHLFPYSLGGSTVASNKIYLCKFHNQMKSNDIHLFPWERGEPEWLSICLQVIERIKRMV